MHRYITVRQHVTNTKLYNVVCMAVDERTEEARIERCSEALPYAKALMLAWIWRDEGKGEVRL